MEDARDATQPVETGPTPSPGSSVQVVPLPSGTTITVRADARGEEIQLRSGNGSMEVRIRMTEDGPVLSLSGVKLEIAASDTIAVNCREFAVNAVDGMRLNTGGDFHVESSAEIRMKSGSATFIDAETLNLNCLDRDGYPDAALEDEAPAALGEGTDSAPARQP